MRHAQKASRADECRRRGPRMPDLKRVKPEDVDNGNVAGSRIKK